MYVYLHVYQSERQKEKRERKEKVHELFVSSLSHLSRLTNFCVSQCGAKSDFASNFQHVQSSLLSICISFSFYQSVSTVWPRYNGVIFEHGRQTVQLMCVVCLFSLRLLFLYEFKLFFRRH